MTETVRCEPAKLHHKSVPCRGLESTWQRSHWNLRCLAARLPPPTSQGAGETRNPRRQHRAMDWLPAISPVCRGPARERATPDVRYARARTVHRVENWVQDANPE